MTVRRKILLSLASLALLLVLAVGVFSGAAVYFRMERDRARHYVPWEETQAIAFAEQGRPFEALVAAHRVSTWNRAQGRAVWRVVRILVRGGHDEAVLRYQETHRFSRNSPPGRNTTSGLDVKLAIIQAELGRMDDANETIRGMERPHDQAKTMTAIARMLAVKGERERAFSMARSTPTPGGRVDTLNAIALVLADRGEATFARELADEALANARRIVKDRDRDYAIRDMTKLFAELGDHEKATELAMVIGEEEIRTTGLWYIASALTRAGRIALARNIVTRIPVHDERSFAVRSIMYIQLENGDAAGAIRTAALLPAGLKREEAIWHATFGHRLDFQFADWDPAIASTLLELADIMARTTFPDTIRYCLLGDALAAGDVVFASRAWLNIENESFRPTVLEMAEHLLYGRRFCRSVS